MRRRRSCILLALGLALALAARAAPAGGVFPYPPLVRDLPNGLRVVLVPTPYPEIVSLHVTVGVGSRNEVEPGKSGFAHFFEHMMFRGTERFPADVYGAILQRAGADQNAYTTDDYTNFHTTFAKEDLERVLELEADRFRNLKYSVDQFKTESRAVLGEYNKNFADPIRKLMEFQRDLVFRKHTYRHTTMGFLRDIEDMPNQYDYSLDFYRRFYRPERTVLSVVGDIDPERTTEWVRKYWGGWERGSVTGAIPEEPAQTKPLVGHVDWPSATLPWIVVGFRGPAFSPREKDMASMDLISALLFSPSSPLYQRLVVEERKVDRLFAYFPDRRDPYLVSVLARVVRPEDAEGVRDAILGEFARARAEPLEEAAIERTKSNLKYSFVHSLDSSAAIADVLARYVRFSRDPGVIDEVYRTYDSVTGDDLQGAARKYFVTRAAHVITLSHGPLPGGWESFPGVETLAGEVARAPSLDEVLIRNASPLVNLRVLWHTGAADDPPGKEGLAALTAAMLSGGGSRSRTFREISERFYPMAATFSNQVDKEMTVFKGVVHRDNLEAYYEIVRDQLLDPGWREADFERVRTRQSHAIEVDLVGNNDEELAKEVLYAEIYRNHPYGHLTLGTVRSLNNLTLDDCREFYRRHYTREKLTLGLAGGVSDAFLSRVRRDFSQLPGADRGQGGVSTAEAPSPPPPPLPLEGPRVTIVRKETRATAISWGFPIDVTRADPDFTALWLVRSYLGEHRSSSSRLYQRIREVRGMNYGDYAYIEYFPRGMFLMQPDPNLVRQRQIFQVWIRPVPSQDAVFALRVSLYEFRKMLREGLSTEQFEAARDYLGKYVNLLVATQDRQLGYAMDSRAYGIGEFSRKIREDLGALTAGEVNRVMRRHLDRDDLRYVFVTKDAAGLRDALLSDAPSSIHYDASKGEDLLAEDRIIAGWTLGLTPSDVRIVQAGEVFAGGPGR